MPTTEDHLKATGAWKRHVNPDGSLGGRVSAGAEIHPTAFVEAGAMVLNGATIGPDARVKAGDLITPTGATLRFDS